MAAVAEAAEGQGSRVTQRDQTPCLRSTSTNTALLVTHQCPRLKHNTAGSSGVWESQSVALNPPQSPPLRDRGGMEGRFGGAMRGREGWGRGIACEPSRLRDQTGGYFRVYARVHRLGRGGLQPRLNVHSVRHPFHRLTYSEGTP